MKLQTLFGVVALALTAQASSNSTTASNTERRNLGFVQHPRSWLNETSKGIPTLNKRNSTVPRSIHVNNGALPIRDTAGIPSLVSKSVKENGDRKDSNPAEHLQAAATAILTSGDVIIEYIPPDHPSPEPPRPASYRWQVSSEVLAQNSPYFRALLDPNKFAEGRQLMNQKTTRVRRQSLKSEKNEPNQPPALEETLWEELPTVRLPSDHFSPKLGVDAIEVFLKILSFNAFDEDVKGSFDAEIKSQRTSLIARVIGLADAFNSPKVVQETLKRSGYGYGRKISFSKFDDQMLKLTEDRIRQSIFIARFLDDRAIFQILTHTLIVLGSRSWANGLEKPTSPLTFPWWYLPDGLEEEVYYRRQCIMNTITDLQAYFLRAYGALEETDDDPKPTNAISFLGGNQSRQYQCRCGYGNSSACDMFHLGQMTRFFALRTKTIFLGSSLLDPDFGPEVDGDDHDPLDHPPPPPKSTPTSGPPTDISAIIASLKQCPDYQIDSNHSGCGIRRRFIPPLDGIEGLVGDRRGLVGIDLARWDVTQWPLASGSWANRALRRALVIEIHFARISAIPRMSPGIILSDSREENARLLFTAKKRRWEA
ncbi:hypothetical protein P170DRAFT_475200 [Aspergillus steynii IBT 23096]|uniref:BTB domain-containing protein n=1 Tax=Aspergillus steynii IBT 23096 TaxID=1392250 RepID=A0A2I2G7L2_9EURO|nr:uncharacterized protein P170DRAFT_475200 [Aspergillus steynii IBT 23096]PLB48869.1 hypothetical protein P170DRAFT_475200 [Aspergillus steynii IBT 23096]